MIRIVGLNCSPRENSNSLTLLETSFERIRGKRSGEVEFEIVNLKDLKIGHCLACDVCGKTKDTGKLLPCAINDDMGMLREKLISADGIAVATPVYFGLPSDLFSKFAMRTRLLRHQDFRLANRVVGVMAIAGRRSGGAETTIIATWLPFIRNGCILVGNGDKTCQFGAAAWAGAKRHVLSDEWGIEQAVDTVDRIYEIAKLIKTGTEALQHENRMVFCYKSGMRA